MKITVSGVLFKRWSELEFLVCLFGHFAKGFGVELKTEIEMTLIHQQTRLALAWIAWWFRQLSYPSLTTSWWMVLDASHSNG